LLLQTLLKHKYADSVTNILTVFFIVFKIYFRVGFIEALDSKGIIHTLKRYYVAMECADVVAFTFVTCDQAILFCNRRLSGGR